MDYGTHTTELNFASYDPQDRSVAADEFYQTSEDLTREQFQAILKELSLIRSNRVA